MASDTYRWLAIYYDHLFEQRRSFEAAHKRIIEPVLRKARSACDLGCGTGDLVRIYARRGLRAFGVDLSPEMCRATRRKLRMAHLEATIIEADMRNFRLPEPVDLISCEFDALNHIPRRSDLSRVFRSVAAALTAGGHFVFDVNNLLAFENIWATTWFIDKDPVAAVMHGGHRPGVMRAWMDVEWFIRSGVAWRRHHEHIEEVCWTDDEIRNTLLRAGFEGIRTWDAAPFLKDAYTRPGYRTFWRARLSAPATSRPRPSGKS